MALLQNLAFEEKAQPGRKISVDQLFEMRTNGSTAEGAQQVAFQG